MRKTIFVFSLFLLSCAKQQVYKEFSDTKFLMDTICEIKVYSETEELAQKVIKEAFEEAEKIDKQFGYTKDSEIYKINNYASYRPVKVSKETLELIGESINASKLTFGAFDITVGVLTQLWGFDEFSKKISFSVPPEEKIRSALKKVGYNNIVLDFRNKTVFLKKKGMRLELGGIAKGYAVFRAAEIIEKCGIKKFLINFGGDIYVKNELDNQPWRIAIQHPRDKSKFLGILELFNTSCFTSGDYERFFKYEGERYHHIIDPKTGYPAKKVISVTIVYNEPVLADALSTGSFVLGEEAMETLKKIGAEYILVKEENGIKILVSDGLKDKFVEIK